MATHSMSYPVHKHHDIVANSLTRAGYPSILRLDIWFLMDTEEDWDLALV